MTRSRRMLEAQRKRERDELPLDELAGGLRRSTSASPVKPPRPASDDEARTSPRRSSRALMQHSPSKSQRTPPRALRRVDVQAKPKASPTAADDEQDAQSSRSLSPPPLCVSSSAPHRQHQQRMPNTDAHNLSPSAADPLMGRRRKTPGTRYPAHLLQVAGSEAHRTSLSPRQSSLSSQSTATPPRVAVTPPSSSFQVPENAQQNPQQQQHQQQELSQVISAQPCSPGPSPSSPLSATFSTQRPAFRAVVSPGMLPQHFSRAGSRHSTPMLSQQPPYHTTTTTTVALSGESGHGAEHAEDEPWSLLPPSMQPFLHEVRDTNSLTPPTAPSYADIVLNTQPTLQTSEAQAPEEVPLWNAFPSAPVSPMRPTRADKDGEEEMAQVTATPPPQEPEGQEEHAVPLKSEWSPSANSTDHKLDVEPHLEDYSGFYNRGNDCYACSVLTLLLRNELFRDRLLHSPPMIAWRLYHGAPLAATCVESGYRAQPFVVAAGLKKEKNRAARAAEIEVMNALEARYGFRLSADDAEALVDEDENEESEQHDDVTTSHARETVHSALAYLVGKQQKREVIVHRVNDRHESIAVRRALQAKMLSVSDDGRRSPAFFVGVKISALANLFDGEFFMGYQEDAHEFLVALVNKLEEEAVRFEKKRRLLVESRTKAKCEVPAGSAKEGSENDDDAQDGHGPVAHASGFDSSPLKQGVPPIDEEAATAEDRGTVDTDRTNDKTDTDDAASSLAALTRSVWVNQLLQGRLLSITRCRHAGCGHEIMSEEPFMNLTLPVTLTAENPPPTTTVSPADNQTSDDGDDEVVRRTAQKTAIAPLPPQPPPVPSLSSLLRQTMQYGLLEGYACDACQTTGESWQGGCFLGSPPPLLLVQLKRFAVSFANGQAVITKEGCPVNVDGTLVVHALLDDLTTAAPPPTVAACYDSATRHFGTPLSNLEKKATATATGSAHEDHEEDETVGDVVLGGDEPQVRALRAEYRLKGLVMHLGNTLHFGHYIAEFAVEEDLSSESESDLDADDVAVKSETMGKETGAQRKRPRAIVDGSDDKCDERKGKTHQRGTRFVWRAANDSRVATLDSARLWEGLQHSRTCYLLLYEKIKEDVVECPLWSVIPRGAA